MAPIKQASDEGDEDRPVVGFIESPNLIDVTSGGASVTTNSFHRFPYTLPFTFGAEFVRRFPIAKPYDAVAQTFGLPVSASTELDIVDFRGCDRMGLGRHQVRTRRQVVYAGMRSAPDGSKRQCPAAASKGECLLDRGTLILRMLSVQLASFPAPNRKAYSAQLGDLSGRRHLGFSFRH